MGESFRDVYNALTLHQLHVAHTDCQTIIYKTVTDQTPTNKTP